MHQPQPVLSTFHEMLLSEERAYRRINTFGEDYHDLNIHLEWSENSGLRAISYNAYMSGWRNRLLNGWREIGTRETRNQN